MADPGKIPIPQRDVACQDLITDSHVIHHGNLRRRRMLNNLAEMVNVKQLKLCKVIRWRQSYVVLHNGCIYIYDNEMSNKPTRATSLYGFTGIEPCSQEVSKGVSWPFKLICALEDKDKAYYFSAPSEKDMKVWTKCIGDQLLAIFKANERPATTAMDFVPSKPQGIRAGAVPNPPLPPPREKVREAEYVLKEDDEDDESLDDYLEIDDEMVEVKNKSEFSRVQSAVKGQPPLPPICLPQPAPRKSQPAWTGRVLSAPLAPTLAPRPRALCAAAVIKTASVDTGFSRGRDEVDEHQDYVEYVDAPQYLELEEDAHMMKKSGIPREAMWYGTPDEADEQMRMLCHNGAYMVRDSSEKGAQTLIVRIESNVCKYKIQMNEKGHVGLMSAGPYFESMASLINFYKSNNIPRYSSTLTLPYSLVRKA